MNRNLIVEFSKMDGAGNDFVVLDNRFYAFSPAELASLALRFCDRRSAIGGDGLLALCPPDDARHAFRMRYYNADGSLGTMCGNGARCLVAFAFDAGLVGDPVVFGSDAGVMRAWETDFPAPTNARDIEVTIPGPTSFRTVDLPVLPSQHDLEPVGYVWTGTEHVVYRVESGLDNYPVSEAGRVLRRHPLLGAAGANVSFVEPRPAIEDPASSNGEGAFVRVRTFEKGVEAETSACGTGAAAVAFCGRELGWWGDGSVEVQMNGGVLRVRVSPGESGDVQLTLAGPARTSFRGTIAVSPTDLEAS